MSRLDDIDLSGAAAVTEPSSPSAKADLAIVEEEPEEPLARAPVSGGSGARNDAYVDLPLGPAVARAPRLPARVPQPAGPAAEAAGSGAAAAAALPARLAAFAADGALVLLLVAAALLAATAGSGRTLDVAGLVWTGVFALYLSFFATVVPLALFGKTVGMALTGLTARGPAGSAPLTVAESARRWLGTALTLFALGIPLLVTRRDRAAPSPGDRLSGRPLTSE